MQSIWSMSADYNESSRLDGDISAEAAVIGGGMAGVLIAYYLNKNGIDTVVLEADEIGSGQTKNTTAKITSQHRLIYSRIADTMGAAAAYKYASFNQRAIDEYESLIKEKDIKCEFKRASAFVYTQTNAVALDREVRLARRLGIDAKMTKETELPFSVESALEFRNQAEFHPLKFLYSLAQELKIYEHTRVLRVEGNTVITDGGSVRAKYIVFATHYPFVNFPGLYFMRMHRERSYVLAISAGKTMENMYLGIDRGGLSFRGSRGAILIGGGSHRTGEGSSGVYDMLSNTAERYYPDFSELSRCSAQDCATLDGIPYIGAFSKKDKNKFIATGFGKWGMTSSMIAALVISDIICGREKPCANIFSPQRNNIDVTFRPLMKETGQAVKGLSKQIFSIPKKTADDLQPGQAEVVWYNGRRAGVYKDENGECFAVSPRCPHLGCRLEWNPDEKTWDCPCHGSRFDYHGELIDNPAQTLNISLKKESLSDKKYGA